MLRITIPETEMWNDETQEFVSGKETTIQLEHSLLSLSRWESKWNKAFLSKKDKTREELVDYVRCMTLNRDVDPELYLRLTPSNFKEIEEYISAPMTATYFRDEKIMGRNRETVTAELIYYWMISLNIPFECQKWHLNRLLALIKVCSLKNTPPKKMSKTAVMQQNRALNEARRKKLHSRG